MASFHNISQIVTDNDELNLPLLDPAIMLKPLCAFRILFHDFKISLMLTC